MRRDRPNKYIKFGPYYNEETNENEYVIGIITGGKDFPEQYKGIMEVMLKTLANNHLFFFIPSEHVGSEPIYEEIQWEGIFETYLYYFSEESVEFFKEKYLPIIKKYMEIKRWIPLGMWVTTNEIKAAPFTNLNNDYITIKLENDIEGIIYLADFADGLYKYNKSSKYLYHPDDKDILMPGMAISINIKDYDLEFRKLYFYGNPLNREITLQKKK